MTSVAQVLSYSLLQRVGCFALLQGMSSWVNGLIWLSCSAVRMLFRLWARPSGRPPTRAARFASGPSVKVLEVFQVFCFSRGSVGSASVEGAEFKSVDCQCAVLSIVMSSVDSVQFQNLRPLR